MDLLEKCFKVSPKYIQLRMKNSAVKQISEAACRIIELRDAFRSQTRIIVNDSLEAAILSGADGVHFGQDDTDPEKVRTAYPELIIGWSTHTIEQVKKANKMRIDYIGFGPVFQSSTKKISDPVVTGLAAQAAEISVHEIIFIGGINRNNIEFLPAGDKIRYALISGLSEMISGKKE